MLVHHRLLAPPATLSLLRFIPVQRTSSTAPGNASVAVRFWSLFNFLLSAKFKLHTPLVFFYGSGT